LTLANDKVVFVDIVACNCGGMLMVQEPNRMLHLNSGLNQVGSSVLIKSPAGTDPMPWTAGAVQATAAGVVYFPLATATSVSGVMANLSGTAKDDNSPSATLTTTWSQVSGPGTVTFANAGIP